MGINNAQSVRLSEHTAPSRSGVRPLILVLLVSLWITSICNVALWRELSRLPDLSTGQVIKLCVSLGLAVLFCTAALLSVFSTRWILKPMVTVFLISAALGAYFMVTYGVVIDKTMMVNTLQTDLRETRDLLSWRLAAYVGVLAVAPSFWVWRQTVRWQNAWRQLLSNAVATTGCLLLTVLVVMVSFQSIASVMRNATHVRYLINPLNSFYALGSLAAQPFQKGKKALVPIGEDAKLGSSYVSQKAPPLLLLVVGETARSGNFSLNGYTRPTNPKLAKETLVSQRNAWSCGTSTAASLPCMFSDLGRLGYDARSSNFEGLLDVLQRAGLAVLWIDNQSGCKGACDRVASVSTTALATPVLCDGGECFDEIMLQGIDERIAALPADRRAKGVVVVMHQMGSHGPAYFKRSPAAFKAFQPECTNNNLQSCSQASLINAYDNSIVYTDHFLASSLSWLKTRQQNATAMVYVSDHGESLGENNLYLHGMPYSVAPDVQKKVPWITWLSDGFTKRSGITTNCLNQRLDTPISHDNYFHSVLGIMNIQTSVYKPSLDMYAACATAP